MAALIGRLIAPFIAALASWLTAQGFEAIDVGWVDAAVELSVMLLVGLLTYGAGHKILDAKFLERRLSKFREERL